MVAPGAAAGVHRGQRWRAVVRLTEGELAVLLLDVLRLRRLV